MMLTILSSVIRKRPDTLAEQRTQLIRVGDTLLESIVQRTVHLVAKLGRSVTRFTAPLLHRLVGRDVWDPRAGEAVQHAREILCR